MLRLVAPICALLLGPAFFLQQVHASLPQDYLDIYVKLNDAERLERSSDFPGALKEFQDCNEKLQKIHDSDPDWEDVLIKSRLEDCGVKMAEIQAKMHVPPTGGTSPNLATNTVTSSGLAFKFTAPPRHPTTNYPWKTDIITTVFWIGEGSVTASGWNSHWSRDNGGADDPNKMSGYASSLHASKVNPFYVALPFNDLAYPKKARQWVPASWAKPPRNGRPASACQNRWVEMKNPSGRTCFAQWEDVGPGRLQQPEYVFGSERPRFGTRAGLDVSPAVARYLGIDQSTTTSWRFVDDDDVQPGMWLKYDEQAILFNAMHENATSAPSRSDTKSGDTP